MRSALPCLLLATACTGRSVSSDRLLEDPCAVEVFASYEAESPFIRGLASDGERIYWLELGRPLDDGRVADVIRSRAKAGGDPRTVQVIPSGFMDAGAGFAVGGGFVYFTLFPVDGPTDVLNRVPVGGGAVELVARTMFVPVHADDDGVAFGRDPEGGAAVAFRRHDGETVVLTPGGTSGPLAVVDGWVYYYDFGATALRRVSTAGGEPVLVATTERVSGVDVDADGVWFTSVFALFNVAFEGGDARQVASGGVQLLGHVRAGDDVLWVAERTRAAVAVVDKDDGTYRRVLTTAFSGGSRGLIVDETHVYATAGGQVLRIGVACRTDLDADGDGVPNAEDNCPATLNPTQDDGDGDGVGDACDLCPTVPDPEQADADDDGVGDACE
jgi:hypothetical protein